MPAKKKILIDEEEVKAAPKKKRVVRKTSTSTKKSTQSGAISIQDDFSDLELINISILPEQEELNNIQPSIQYPKNDIQQADEISVIDDNVEETVSIKVDDLYDSSAVDLVLDSADINLDKFEELLDGVDIKMEGLDVNSINSNEVETEIKPIQPEVSSQLSEISPQKPVVNFDISQDTKGEYLGQESDESKPNNSKQTIPVVTELNLDNIVDTKTITDENKKDGAFDLNDLSGDDLGVSQESGYVSVDVGTLNNVPVHTKSSSGKGIFISIFTIIFLSILGGAVYFVYDVMDPHRELFSGLFGDINKKSVVKTVSSSASSISADGEESGYVSSDSGSGDSQQDALSGSSSSETMDSAQGDDQSSELTGSGDSIDNQTGTNQSNGDESSDGQIIESDSSSSDSMEDINNSSSSQVIDETSDQDNSFSSSSQDFQYDSSSDNSQSVENIISINNKFKDLLKKIPAGEQQVTRKIILTGLKKSKKIQSQLENGEDFDITKLQEEIKSLERILDSSSKKINE